MIFKKYHIYIYIYLIKWKIWKEEFGVIQVSADKRVGYHYTKDVYTKHLKTSKLYVIITSLFITD